MLAICTRSDVKRPTSTSTSRLVHTEYPGGVYNNTGPNAPECAGLSPDGSGKAKNYPSVSLTVSPCAGTTRLWHEVVLFLFLLVLVLVFFLAGLFSVLDEK